MFQNNCFFFFLIWSVYCWQEYVLLKTALYLQIIHLTSGCSGNGRRTNETMRLIVTTFAGIVFGFFLGASFPTLSLTKVLNLFLIPPQYKAVLWALYISNVQQLFTVLAVPLLLFSWIWQMNLPSSLFPSLDLAYIEDKYSGLSTQALLNIWSSLRRNKDSKNPGSAKVSSPIMRST